MMVDGDVHANVKPDKVASLLKRYRDMKKPAVEEGKETARAEGTGRARSLGESDSE
jgi:hypothetical protein